MAINKKELHKLLPEERIKRLKLMEDERKKEVNEIERLIKDSMQEMKTDKLAEDISPEQKPVDISKLFETSGGERLERTARESRAPSKVTKGYMSAMQVEYDYSNLKKLYSVVSSGGSLTEEEKKMVGEIGERINVAEKYITESDKLASKLIAGRALLYKMWKETGLG